jgi:hypothetical protein
MAALLKADPSSEISTFGGPNRGVDFYLQGSDGSTGLDIRDWDISKKTG